MKARLEPLARPRFGPQWVSALARAAGWKPQTLQTLFHRGQRLPPADRLARLEEALGLREPLFSAVTVNAVEPWHQDAWQRARTFTGLVEMLRRLEEQTDRGDVDAATRRKAAWQLLVALRPAIERLAYWTGSDWEQLYTRRLDHWRRLTRRIEADVIARALKTAE